MPNKFQSTYMSSNLSKLHLSFENSDLFSAFWLFRSTSLCGGKCNVRDFHNQNLTRPNYLSYSGLDSNAWWKCSAPERNGKTHSTKNMNEPQISLCRKVPHMKNNRFDLHFEKKPEICMHDRIKTIKWVHKTESQLWPGLQKTAINMQSCRSMTGSEIIRV